MGFLGGLIGAEDKGFDTLEHNMSFNIPLCIDVNVKIFGLESVLYGVQRMFCFCCVFCLGPPIAGVY